MSYSEVFRRYIQNLITRFQLMNERQKQISLKCKNKKKLK